MKTPEQTTVTIPGIYFSMRTSVPVPPGSQVTTTAGTGHVNFQAVKKVLTNKPLRRPNRTKPIDD